MRLQFASDLHLEFRTRERGEVLGGNPLHPTDAEAIVLAGDIATGSAAVDYAAALSDTHGKPVILVPGNHEYYGSEYTQQRQAMQQRANAYPGVHVLAPGCVELGGIRFVGATLWTDFALFGDLEQAMCDADDALYDFIGIRVGSRTMTPTDQRTEHCRELAYLRAVLATPFDGPSVVVTHHAPAWGSVAPHFRRHELTPAFVSNLESVVAESGAAVWIHGHTHGHFDYHVGATRVVCNAGGYPKEGSTGLWLPGYRPDWIITVGE